MNEILNLSARDKVNAIETEILKHEQIELELEHYFAPGVCVRQLFVPKGVLLTGKIHKYQQLHFVLRGDISILIGDELKRFKTSSIISSPAGSKRVAYAHEDTIWMMVLGTHETDIEKIEQQFTAATEKEYLAFCKQIEADKCLE